MLQPAVAPQGSVAQGQPDGKPPFRLARAEGGYATVVVTRPDDSSPFSFSKESALCTISGGQRARGTAGRPFVSAAAARGDGVTGIAFHQ